MEILCFFAGIAFFYQKSLYPLGLIAACLYFRPKPSLLFWFIAALTWAFVHQLLNADRDMGAQAVIKRAILQGYISSIPSKTPDHTQFQFLVQTLNGNKVRTNLLLSCYKHCPDVHIGEYWQLQAKLKRAQNLANPGGFDYVNWLASRHIVWRATAYTDSFKRLSIPNKPYILSRIRVYLADTLARLVPETEILGVFEALTLGLTNHIAKNQWDLFRRTGTTHLIDISGEHIALIVALSYGFICLISKYAGTLCLYYPAPKIAGIGSIIIAALYTLIAGFAVPTQRSLIACCLVLMRHFINQRMSIWQTWRYALFAVLLFEPHAVFMLGFYFSFIAVAILILIKQRFQLKHFSAMLAMQCACLLGLMPLSLYWFSYASINGLAANLIAIPLMGFVIVPLALTIAFLSPIIIIPGSIFLLKSSITIFLNILHFIDSCSIVNLNFSFTEALNPLALMLATAIFMLLPLTRLFPAAGLIILAAFIPHYEKIKPNAVKIDVLDVGQGLAIVARTAHHTLIYDTGMKFYNGGDMGKTVIIPYLNTLGIKDLDMVVVSHADIDHRGGLLSLSAAYPIHKLLVDDPSLYQGALSCHNYPAWTWDGVLFKFFPIKTHLHGKNNNSCILQISNAAGQILLDGDIEKPAENYLISTYGKQLASSIMLIPHHASKSSSQLSYVQQVAPSYALASYGLDNRYHFPHSQALASYQTAHTPVYNTQDCGMISITLNPGQKPIPQCWRQKSN